MAVRTALWKADRLLRLNGKSIEASGMLNTIVNSFGGDKSIQIRECVACTLYNKAALLHWLGQLEGACELVDKLVSDYRSAPPLVRLWAAKGLVACADWLTEAHRHVEARERCEQIGDLYHDESWAGLARSQIQTLQWKNATVLREEVDTGGTSWDAEYDAFEAAVIVAKAAYSRAAFLVEEGRFDEAIRALTSLIETFSPYSHDALRTTVIPARIIRGDVECFRNNYLGARQDYDSVVDGIEAEDDSAFYTKALVRKAMILELSGLGDRARVVYVDAARRYGVAIDRDPGAYLGCLAASEVWQMALESAAVQARHIMDRWDFNKESERRERTVPVLAAIMTLLGLGGWYAEVLAVCDALIERCSKSSGEDDLLEWKVQALVRKVSVLVERAEWRSAIELYDSLESAYRNAADQTLRTCFASALAQEAFYLRRLRKD
jgi:tetratricopeptide (TPR) repeat protein